MLLLPAKNRSCLVSFGTAIKIKKHHQIVKGVFFPYFLFQPFYQACRTGNRVNDRSHYNGN